MAVFIKFEENDVAYGVLSLVQWFLTFFEVREHFWSYEKFAEHRN